MFAQEGAVAAGSRALELPSVAKWRADIGKPMSTGEMIEDPLETGLGAGAFAVAGKALGEGVLAPAFRGLVKAIAKDGDAVPPSVRAAANVVADEQERADQNPLADTDIGRDDHRVALDQAITATNENAPEALPSLTGKVVRAADPAIDAEAANGSAGVMAFDPRSLNTDAATMQYKGNADEQGVTDRLQGVDQWNPMMAGQALVWQRNDGKLIVADGHQRLALALRALDDGQNPAEVKMYGVLLREEDGVTAQQARVLAALKNIAEGSGEAIDAARVLRDAPDGVSMLPPRSPLVRRAQDLARLSDDAWGMAWNGAASEDHAALVGRLVDQPELHAPILSYLTKANPETREEAEITVRQALEAGSRSEVQTDMFGTMLKQDLILPERVKILKNALTSIRKDRSLFKTLTDRAQRITEEGNTLESDRNAAVLARANAMFENIKALAQRKGEISDALQRAAVASKENGNRAAAVRQFIQDVSGTVERGGLDRDETGRAIGAVDAAPTGAGDATEGGGAGEVNPPSVATRPPSPVNGGGNRGFEFADPEGKPEAFEQQRKGLARELGGEAMHAPQPVGAGVTPVRDRIEGLLERAKGAGEVNERAELGPAEPWLIRVAKASGLDLTGYTHVLDSSTIRHILREHGDAAAEEARGQIAVSEADVRAIPEIVSNPDQVVLGSKKSKRGLDTVAYVKAMPDGATLVIEEARTGQKTLAPVTMWKYPAAPRADTLKRSLEPNVRNDGGSFKIVDRPAEDKGMAAGEGGGAAEAGASPLGAAADEIRALDALDPKTEIPALPGTEETRTVADLKDELENEARAVERLRRCADGEA